MSCCRYGVILEKFQNQDPSLMGRIKGCIVDSAPVAASDPQVNDACTFVGFVLAILLLFGLYFRFPF